VHLLPLFVVAITVNTLGAGSSTPFLLRPFVLLQYYLQMLSRLSSSTGLVYFLWLQQQLLLFKSSPCAEAFTVHSTASASTATRDVADPTRIRSQLLRQSFCINFWARAPYGRSWFVFAQEEGSTDLTELEQDDDDSDFYFEDDDDNDDEQEDISLSPTTSSSRWEKLNQRIKNRIIQEGQQRAIANKKKQEPNQEKKRRKCSSSGGEEVVLAAEFYRMYIWFHHLCLLYFSNTHPLKCNVSHTGMMMYFKEKQREKKQASKVQRSLPFDQRTPLSVLIPGMNVTGTVISITKYGAYVDVGTECDGLLHVSQITNDFFVEHPKQVLTPGQEVTVAIRSVNAEKKKLHLTMLPEDLVQAEQLMKSEEEQEDRIPFEDIFVDDELWGEIRRVTDYGAYVEVGAVVHGWLHFMDHPAFGWSNGEHPSAYMSVGDRVRVWVSDVDHTQKRIKLTANRPSHLPGPRRAM
jgi:predicted RNA-binding protein with RPS1 domain